MTRNGRAVHALVALVLTACGSAQEAQPEAAVTLQAEQAQRQARVLEEVDTILQEDYLFGDFGGLDWNAEVASLHAVSAAGMSDGSFYEALAALLARLPQGTVSFTTRQGRIESDLAQEATYGGIGAFVAVRGRPDPRVVLLAVMEGSPAEEAGLRAHDAIYAIDGEPVQAEEGLAAIERMRGPVGTEVILEVASPGDSPREVRVTRGQIAARSAIRGGLLSPGVLYLLVPVDADEGLVDALGNLLQSASEQTSPVFGIVLDLRIAGSGGNWPLNQMLTLLGSGEMGFLISRDETRPLVVPGRDFAGSQTLPLVVLIGPDTSGPPEIFAGALQTSGRARLVGLPTQGNVLSFQRQVIADGSLLVFAVSTFSAVEGDDLLGSGLTPDFTVFDEWDEVKSGDDPVLEAAIEFVVGGR